ncbi:TolC family protein [Leadbetterella sp. DM7]|uniref:TolC family protein n=1 Tax=Leadbetterella sp. DM7 TaxID=3235085 RepID=UPI00349EE2B1
MRKRADNSGFFLKGTVAILFLGFGFSLFTPKAFAQSDTLTLSDAISIAHEHSLSGRKARMEYRVAQNRVLYSKAEIKPQVGLGGTLPNFYKTTSAITQPDGTISFLPVSQDNSSVNLNLTQRLLNTNTLFFAESGLRRYNDFTENGVQNFNSVPFRIGIEQPINTFNTLKWNRRFYLLEEEIAKAGLDMNREQISGEVTAAFFELLAAQVNHEIALTNTGNSEKIYQIALERDKLGKISKSDLLQLELSLNSARQSAVNARREVLRANAELKKAMGWETANDQVYVLRSPESLTAAAPDPAAAAQKAWMKRPEQKQMEKLLLETERALEQARKNNGWQGSLSATFGWVGTGARFPQSYQLPQVENFVQLTLRIPLLDGGKRKYSVNAALEQQQYAEAEKEFTEQTFKQNVRQLALQFRELNEEVELGAKSLEIARERYEIANRRYLLNDISITDLSIAFNERDMAWRNYTGLLRAYWVTYYALRQLTLENF